MPRNNILLRRLPAPKRVRLQNGRVFFAKYQRVNRHALAPTQGELREHLFEILDPDDKE